MRPRLLRADNVTPATRTPWGGRRILDHYKRGLDLPRFDARSAALAVCGESWEVSVEPSFPSRFADDDTLLCDAIARNPAGWLGEPAVRRGLGQSPLLAKLVDASQHLSVQVHPAIDDPALAHDESGKVEVLFVLHASGEHSRIYLGFRDDVSRRDVEDCLRTGGQLDQLMNFVSVRPGDALTIEAGTVHAIGPGITLFEPQYISPGRRGVTYRFWDWNRRYDRHGVLSDDGDPRPLHIDRALEVTDWDGPRGQALLDRCLITEAGRHADGRTSTSEPAESVRALTRERVTTSSRFAVERWFGAGERMIPAMDTLLAVVCVAGAGEVHSDAGSLSIRRGQSAVVPAAAGDLTITGHPESGHQPDERSGHRASQASLEPGIELLVTYAV